MQEINQEQTEKKEKRRKLIWLLLLLLLIGVFAWYITRSSDRAPLISADLLPEVGDASDQHISERAQEIADGSSFTLQINPEAIFEDGYSKGSIEIVNPGTNIYPIAVDIALIESDEIVYSSGAIYPNQFIEQVNLAIPLTEGIYPAKAMINIYDPDTKEKQGVTEAELTIIVKK